MNEKQTQNTVMIDGLAGKPHFSTSYKDPLVLHPLKTCFFIHLQIWHDALSKIITVTALVNATEKRQCFGLIVG